MLTAIQHKRCKVVKYLLKHFGDKVNLHGTFEWSGAKYENVSPLCAAIISRQTEIVLEFVIVGKGEGKGQLGKVTADIKKSSLDKEHKIEALELMGAICALYTYDRAPNWNWHPSPTSRYVFSIWKEAMKLRYSTVDGQPVILKTISPPSDLFARAMGFTSEFLTLEHLEQIETQIGLWGFYTQALLVVHRILDRKDPEQHKYILKQLGNLVVVGLHQHNEQFNIKIGMFMLDEFQGLQEWDEEVNDMVIETIGHLVKNFMKLYGMRSGRRRFHHLLVKADVIKTLEFTLHFIHQASAVNIHSRYDDFCFMIFDQIDREIELTEMLPKLSNQEIHRFK
jgi:hypothetical protein